LTGESTTHELVAVAHAWDRAMVTNDAAAIGNFMADDWIIVGSDGSVTDKAGFLGLVESGIVTHDLMTSENMRVRVYGDAAVITADGVSAGTYHGEPFREVERASSVFVRRSGQWRCVLTHLSRLGS